MGKDKVPQFTLDYQVLPLSRLRDNPTNPNVMSPPQMALLKKNILREGFKDPMIVRETGQGDYIILDGHHRKLALLELGASEGPCIIDQTDYGGKSEVEQINLSGLMLNRIKGRLDPTKVGALLMGLRENYGPADISDITGYSSQDLENYASVLQIPELPDLSKFADLHFFSYPGGKFRTRGQYLSIIPPHTVFVEVFGGAGHVILNKPEIKGVVDVYNDLDGRLVNLFETVRTHLDEFEQKFLGFTYSRELFETFQDQPDVEGDKVESAFRFYYLLWSSFNGDVKGSWSYSRIRNQAVRFWKNLDGLERIWRRLQSVVIERLDFREAIQRYDSPETVFFVDPPYYGVNYYTKQFQETDHEDLYKLLCGAVLGKWILTYNNCRWVRERYKGKEWAFASAPLTMSLKTQGEERETYHNLVITNFALPGVKIPLDLTAEKEKTEEEPLGTIVSRGLQ